MKTRLSLLLALFTVCFAQAQTYTQTTIVTGLTYPVAFDVLPNGNYLVTQKGGNSNPATNAQIKVFSPSGTYIGVFYDLSDSVDADFERGLLGICVDPNFSTNKYVYAYYVHLYNADERIRIVRFTENNNVGTNPTIIFDFNVPDNLAGNHFGGNLHMHASEPDKLYFTIGDVAIMANGQSLTVPYGKFNRIKTDGTIPTDNPFYDDGNPTTGNCDLIWTYGHRNPFDFCFSPVNDSLYSSENGLNTWDESNQIIKGKNYGWSTCEGNYLINSTTSPCNNPSFTAPLTTWAAPLPAVTGILIYSGTTFPTFDTHMMICDNDYGRVYNCTLGNAPAYNTVSSNVQWTDLTTSGGLTTMKEGTDGCIYAMLGGYTTNGKIYRVCPQGLYVGDNTEQDYFLNTPSPNPFIGTAQLNYILKKAGSIRITLTDVLGKNSNVLLNENKTAGNYSLELNANSLGLSAGTYFCTLSVSDAGQELFSQTVRVVVSK